MLGMHVAELVEPWPLEYPLGDLVDRLRRDRILSGVEVNAVDIDELFPGLRCARLRGCRLRNFGHGRISCAEWRWAARRTARSRRTRGLPLAAVGARAGGTSS